MAKILSMSAMTTVGQGPAKSTDTALNVRLGRFGEITTLTSSIFTNIQIVPATKKKGALVALLLIRMVSIQSTTSVLCVATTQTEIIHKIW